MTLAAGARLGPYEILGPLGAGGMGEVHRARDTRLDRTVAIKVLPSHLSGRPELRARFEREARAVSSLSHPNICTLYDVGHQDGVDYLVMEYLEGETLSERLQRGPLPVAEMLRCAVQIADALDRAHRKGLIHRDLKPGNIMLTRAGAKLLDFGLAKSLGAAGAPSNMTASPTVESPLTTAGAIVGTFQYMAPEQLEGKEADARSDIFAFGAVLYEMATGARAFEGKTQALLVASILKEEPRPVTALQPSVPPSIGRLVRTCLEKDPEERRQSMHDVLLELRGIAEPGSQPGAPAPAAARAGGRGRLWMAAALVMASIAAGLATALVLARRPAGPAATVRFVIPATEKVSWRPWNSFAISPDGRRLVLFAEGADGVGRFWMRSLDSLEMRPLPGTETGNASFPFWSPDSRFIGFFAGEKLKRIDVAGGPPQSICDVADGRGGTWSRDGTIVFSAGVREGLFRVPASGGEPVPLTTPGGAEERGGHLWPSFLPDGRHFTYLSAGGGEEGSWINVGSLDGGETRRLVGGESGAVHVEPGWLLFLRQGTLLAQPFDARALQMTGDPVPLAESVSRNTDTFYSSFSVSGDGVLVYKSGADLTKQLAWFDRSGKFLGPVGPQGDVGNPDLSPDGARLALERVEPSAVRADIWVVELSRGTSSRLTFEPENESFPIWSPDGIHVYYNAEREEGGGVYRKPASGAGSEELVRGTKPGEAMRDVSRDGRFLVGVSGSIAREISIMPLSDGGAPRLFTRTPFDENNVKISPDGRWIAYDSDESGRPEVYVQSFPEPGGKWQISTGGGLKPRWRGDGRELYFLALDRTLMAVSVSGQAAAFEAGAPEPLFPTELPVAVGRYPYTAAADGRRFLVARPESGGEPAPFTVVLDWPAELKR